MSGTEQCVDSSTLSSSVGETDRGRRGKTIFIYISDALTFNINGAGKLEICNIDCLSITGDCTVSVPIERLTRTQACKESRKSRKLANQLEMINITLCHRFRQIFAGGWINLLCFLRIICLIKIIWHKNAAVLHFIILWFTWYLSFPPWKCPPCEDVLLYF